MKNNRPREYMPDTSNSSKAKDIFNSERSFERSSLGNGSPETKKYPSEPTYPEGLKTSTAGTSVRKVKVSNLKLKQAQIENKIALKRSPLKFGTPTKGSNGSKPTFIRKIFDFFSPSRKRSGSQEKYKVEEEEYFANDNKIEIESKSGLIPTIKVTTENHDSNEPSPTNMGDSIEERIYRGNSFRRDLNYNPASSTKTKEGGQEVNLFSPKKRLLFKNQRSNIKFNEHPNFNDNPKFNENPFLQINQMNETFGKFQLDSKEPVSTPFLPEGGRNEKRQQYQKELSKDFPGINKVFAKGITRQYSGGNIKESDIISFNHQIDDQNLVVNAVPNTDRPKLLEKDKKESTIFKRGKRSFSPTPFNSPNSVRLKPFRRAPSPEDMKYLVTDKDTGLQYDMREEEGFDPRTEEIMNKLKRKKELAWKDWWDKKRETTKMFLRAVKENKTLEMEKYLMKELGDMRVDPDSRDEKNVCPLHYAATLGNLEMLLILLKNDATIDITTPAGATPLILAAQKGFENIILVLLNAGSEINHQDNFKNTSMHYAIIFNQTKVVKILLASPSLNLTLRNLDEKVALDYQLSPEMDEMIMQVNLTKQKDSEKRTKINIEKISENNFSSEKSNSDQSKSNNERQDEIEKQSTLANNSIQNPKELKITAKNFSILKILGKGSFGNVFLVQKNNTNDKYAMKVLKKDRIFNYNLLRYAFTERNILCSIDHPFIVKLSYAFQSHENLYLLLTYCPNGDLGKHLMKEKKFSEEKAKIYTAQVLLALEELHRHDIIYRDLKPDNVVLDKDGNAMITDFGLSKEKVKDAVEGGKSFCGSVAYLAPEMLKKAGHGKAVDWYLLGVLFYEMVTGSPPYYAATRDQIFNNIQKNNLSIPNSISDDAKSFLRSVNQLTSHLLLTYLFKNFQILNKDPFSRLGSGGLGSEELKSHPFFKDINWTDLFNKKIKTPFFNKILDTSPKRFITTLDDFAESDPSSEYHLQGWSFIKSK